MKTFHRKEICKATYRLVSLPESLWLLRGVSGTAGFRFAQHILWFTAWAHGRDSTPPRRLDETCRPRRPCQDQPLLIRCSERQQRGVFGQAVFLRARRAPDRRLQSAALAARNGENGWQVAVSKSDRHPSEGWDRYRHVAAFRRGGMKLPVPSRQHSSWS